jgi:flagellar basal-body rod protein FlgG
MIGQQTNLDVISNNLANVNTTGFKKGRAEFHDLLYQTHRYPGTETAGGQEIPVGIQVGMGTRVIAVNKMFQQGDYKQTGNDLDLAIEGDGFFLVQVNGEDAYTRAGAFELNNEGTIVTANGYVLQPEFQVPDDTTSIEISENGHVSCLDSNGSELAATDIEIYSFINNPGLRSAGRNLYYQTEASGEATAGTPGDENFGTIAQGYLEMSNVELVDEMVNMIVGQRAYEANSKSITTSDSMLSIANQLKR